MSQILSHPFMTMQSWPSQETQLYQQQQHSSLRGFAPSSLASLDSGHGTHCTMSSNNTLSGNQHHHHHHGPLRATLRPRGLLPQHVPPSFQSGSSSDGNVTRSGTPTRGSARASPCPSSSKRPLEGDVLYRSKSMDVLPAEVEGKEAWSYHSQPQLTTRQTNSEHSDERDKENRHVSKLAITVDVQHQRVRRPFQDNTNGQGGSSAPPATPTKKQQQQQRKSLKELVPPLNAARLPPFEEALRNGVVSDLWELTS